MYYKDYFNNYYEAESLYDMLFYISKSDDYRKINSGIKISVYDIFKDKCKLCGQCDCEHYLNGVDELTDEEWMLLVRYDYENKCLFLKEIKFMKI
jgi:hypothetical protein